ncbi:hypothetical protein HAHI6034_07315 [Hathewaya histolytica]|uniref:Membrane protein-like protein n=1 Tax=Hathewaya histolytica TaxID=1498 RepID=A0A4U9QV43_HATHI|nr:hypothetical protein [Hathewaya histolytica]VTQ82584.1 membrane protein-like protein [Hathewaya histolytica]
MNTMSKKVVSLVVLGTMLGGQVVFATTTTNNSGVKKDESVFVTLTEKGEVKEQIVSDWIHSDKTNTDIKDKSNLKDIKNVKGEEKPVTNGENLTWKSDKNDIYYQGKTDKQLPIEVKVTYEFDGKEVSPKDIVGKTGKLKMKLQVINKDAHKVTVKGKEKTVYTPFAAASVINLPLEHFTNVKVNTGEIISEGNNQIVTFISLPGMKESLDIKEETLDIDLKDTLELTCDTKDFEMGSVMVTATSKLPEQLDKLKEAKDLNELTDGLNKMKDASNKLVDGTSKLADGAKTMADKVGLLNSAYSGLDSGIGTLSSGSKKLYDGADKLSNGTSMLAKEVNNISIPDMSGMKNQVVALKNGVSELDVGANKLAKGMPALQKGTEDLLDGAKRLNGGLDSVLQVLDKSYKLQAGQEQDIGKLVEEIAQMEQIIASMPDGKQKEMLKGGLTKQKDTLQQIKIKGIGKTKALDGLKSVITGEGLPKDKKGLKQGTRELVVGLTQMNEQIPAAVEGSRQLAAGTGKLKAEINKGMASLDEKLKAVDPSKIVKLKAATKQLDAGANELKNGVGQLSSGSSKLKEGSTKVSSGISALKDGSGTLAEKSGELRDGMAKFDNEGIKKVDDKLGSKVGDIEELIDTKNEVMKLSDNFKTYTGVGEGMEGSVKFIMKTDEIKKPKVEKKEEVKEEKVGFFKRIVNLFKGK